MKQLSQNCDKIYIPTSSVIKVILSENFQTASKHLEANSAKVSKTLTGGN